jgi:glycosyltransferase involved in cell wall biosynthesis
VKILFVSAYFPWPLVSGGCQRRFHLVEALARRHDVTLVALTREEPSLAGWTPCPLRQQCQRVIAIDARSYLPASARSLETWAPIGDRIRELFVSPAPAILRYWNTSAGLVEFFCDLRRSDHFDAVWVDRSYFGAVLRRAGFDRLVVDVDDLESIFAMRNLRISPWYRSKPLHYIESAKLYFYERSLPRWYWRLVVCKEEDRGFFGSYRRKVFVVPNGVVECPVSPPTKERPGNVLFIGLMDMDPNIDAVMFFARSVLPRLRALIPETCFHVVGKDPPVIVRTLHDGVSCLIHGLAPDLTPFYESASVVVAPIRQGSGTRLKVLEALAWGKAMVATTTAIEGLDLRPGVDLEIADDPEALARTCTRLLRDPAARHRLGEAGRQRVSERYRWDKIGEMAECVLTPAPNCLANARRLSQNSSR